VPAAAWLAAAVVSHWVLDWISHRPDLPLTPWSDRKFGLGLWNNVPLTLAIEAAMFAAALWIYSRVTRPRGRTGRLRLYVFAAGLAIVYVANLMGPPPPGERSLAWVGAGLWLFAVWAAWVDRAREPLA
jgi:hypothetical protein